MDIRTDFPTTNSKHTTVVTIGNFDGCHRGHQSLFEQCLSHSQHKKVAITFNAPNKGWLFSSEHKYQTLAGYGFDACVVKELDSEFTSISHVNFLHDYLLKRLNMKALVAGANFRFGYNRLGDADYLQAEEQAGQFKFTAVKLLYAGKVRISSSNVRQLLRAGDVSAANAMLGKDYTLSGVIVKGMQRGREINTPTLNLSINKRCIVPKSGVYIGTASLNASTYSCVINIGTRPTLSSATDEVIEAHVIDAQLPTLYGNRLKLAFQQRLRSEIRFATVEDLKQQIQQDIQAARRYEQFDK